MFNAVVVAVLVMLVLSLLRTNVVIALVIGAITGGLSSGLSMSDTVAAFTDGLGNGASIALSYALLGGFAVAIARTGLPELLVSWVLKVIRKDGESERRGFAKALIIFILLTMSILSQNLIPIHIAFIPLLVPPILHLLNLLKVDRRLIASVITFGLTAPYILLPVGFGAIFHEIIATQMETAGLAVDLDQIPMAMIIPVAGMVIGLIIAVFVTYRKERTYEDVELASLNEVTLPARNIVFTVLSLVVSLVAQLSTDSMIIGALAGIVVLAITGAMKWKQSDEVLTEGMKLMAFIGFVMIAANGFANVLQVSGDIESLVQSSADLFNGSKGLAAFMMLAVGLLITMGIGSSFATIPIIATIFVPLAMEFGFGTMAIIALIGTAGALGDAGSPASDSTLGPTAGLNVDGQHNHIWDTVVPTFIHYNIPLLIFGWIAVMIL
ncbi:Na+/H+ antiporter family protein [Paenisporosarcina cavernae]|uniref:TRAP transporter large permease subunit n=1 Tax=Paenisporosarcina cavernae TaxID=2320858 RepID=A0A385YUP8_9BACL|nr:Na+/H+ antiporter family protein [Paenisporosarcina cavernae]AYC30615.1 TRAP transporter large permease subunit [Paenisporosarcina cavernae]